MGCVERDSLTASPARGNAVFMLLCMRPPIGTFEAVWPAVERPELLGPPVSAALESLPGGAGDVLVADTDPAVADTANFCERYGVRMEESANCVVISAKRGGVSTLSACVVLAHTRADVNGVVRRRFGARKASFAPREMAVQETGMEFGGITPLGLPDGWSILVDSAVCQVEWAVVGSGLRRSKLLVPGRVIAKCPGAEVIQGLALE